MKRYFLKHKWICCQYLFFIILNALVPILSAQWITMVTAYALDQKGGVEQISIYLILICIYTLIIYLAYGKVKQKYKEEIMTEIEQEIYSSILLQHSSDFHQNEPSEYSSFFLNELKIVEESYLMQIPSLISACVQMILVGIYVVVTVQWWVLIYFIISSVLLMQIPKIMSKKIHFSTKKFTDEAGRITMFLKEAFHGFDTLFGNHVQYQYVEQTKKEFFRYEKSHQKLNWLMDVADSLSNGFGLFFQFGLLLLLGIGVVQGTIQNDCFLAVTSISSSFMNGVFVATAAFSKIQAAIPIVDRIKIFQQNTLIPKNDNNENSIDAIQLEHIDCILNGKKILDNLSYRFEKGKKYLIIGESGSGKTTLFNLLNGKIHSSHGSIKAIVKDGDIPLYKYITTINQKPFSFQGTCSSNICMGREVSQNKIKELLEYVHLPLSLLNQKISEESNSISGGELQRVAIARGLIDTRSFLLCDEICANLDKNSAHIIENAICDLDGIGVLFIAHHYTDELRKRFDVVLELKDGRLIEE
ncbi:hypothetical protein C815_02017 [Firmicutes bacterium M10-2]|nr:hypothetical protein C815_02017 [Firmicutes bacterium M10-2]